MQGIKEAEIVQEQRHFRSRSVTEIKTYPHPEWLIAGILPMSALSIIYGDYGVGKSFLLLDWALCIATGRQWAKKPCKKGLVYYIAGEGFGEIGKQVKAWERYNGETVGDGLYILGESMHLVKDISKLERDIETLPSCPILIIIDTWARCTLGGDENSGKEVGESVYAVDQLRKKYKSHIAIVHHKPKSGNGARGHTALPAAADTVIDVVKTKNTILLKCEKQKESMPFENIPLTQLSVDLNETDEFGENATSCVLVEGTISASEISLTHKLNRALTALMRLNGEANCTRWMKATGFSNNIFHRVRGSLAASGLVEGQKAGRETLYTLTPQGKMALNALISNTP